MKLNRVVLLPIFLFPMFISCNKSEIVNCLVYYKVADECINMGTIKGTTRQNPLVGEYTTEVTAEAKSGYVFIGWDDGLTNPTRSDLAKAVLYVTYQARFEAHTNA